MARGDVDVGIGYSAYIDTYDILLYINVIYNNNSVKSKIRTN